MLAFVVRLNAADALVFATNFVTATSPEILVEGRCAKTASGSVRLGFTGTTFHLRCHGSSLAMRVNGSSDEVYFDVQTDGGEPVRLRCHAGEGEYPLLENAAVADHVLEITRRSESWQGTCEVLGFKLGDGEKLLPPPALPARKLMFIGDSITCGAATDIRPDDPLKGKTAHEDQTSNARLSFGKILARRLHAQCHLVSYGGRGIFRDWQGFLVINNAPEFYELALPDDPTILWYAADYVPDAIVICLGTNDFNQGVPDEIVFVNAYVEFIRKVRRDAPRAETLRAARLYSGCTQKNQQPRRDARAGQPLRRRAEQRASDGRGSRSHGQRTGTDPPAGDAVVKDSAQYSNQYETSIFVHRRRNDFIRRDGVGRDSFHRRPRGGW